MGAESSRPADTITEHGIMKPVDTADTDVNNPNLQRSCPLFKLPAEIRNQIYEEVFGAGFAHFRIRKCNATDNWLPSMWHEFPEDPAFPNHYEKWSYQACSDPKAWTGPYAASKNPAASRGQSSVAVRSSSGLFSAAYEQNHCDCDLAIRELEYGEYAMVDCSNTVNAQREHTDPENRCNECTHLNNEITELYGPAAEGLKKWHSDTGIDLNLLQTCRMIYHEAYLLPFKAYTFDLTKALNASQIRDRLPMTGGLRRIETVHWFHCCANELYRLVLALPGLRSLKLSLEHAGPVMGSDEDWQRFFSVNPIRSVQVITGSLEDQPDLRPRNQAFSSALENFLTSSSWEEAEEVANTFWSDAVPLSRYGQSFGLLVSMEQKPGRKKGKKKGKELRKKPSKNLGDGCHRLTAEELDLAKTHRASNTSSATDTGGAAPVHLAEPQ